MSFYDVAPIMLGVGGFMLVVIIMYPLIFQMFAVFTSISPNQAATISDIKAQVDNSIAMADMALPAILFIIGALSVAAASNVPASPAFFFVMLIFNIALLIGADVIERVYNAAVAINPQGQTFLVWTPLFLQNLPKLSIGLMIAIAFVQYGKNMWG